MSKKDKVKEQIGILKFWLGIVVGVILAIVGWSVTNYKTLESPFLILVFFVIIFLAIIIACISKHINEKIEHLEEL